MRPRRRRRSGGTGGTWSFLDRRGALPVSRRDRRDAGEHIAAARAPPDGPEGQAGARAGSPSWRRCWLASAGTSWLRRKLGARYSRPGRLGSLAWQGRAPVGRDCRWELPPALAAATERASQPRATSVAEEQPGNGPMAGDRGEGYAHVVSLYSRAAAVGTPGFDRRSRPGVARPRSGRPTR